MFEWLKTNKCTRSRAPTSWVKYFLRLVVKGANSPVWGCPRLFFFFAIITLRGRARWVPGARDHPPWREVLLHSVLLLSCKVWWPLSTLLWSLNWFQYKVGTVLVLAAPTSSDLTCTWSTTMCETTYVYIKANGGVTPVRYPGWTSGIWVQISPQKQSQST